MLDRAKFAEVLTMFCELLGRSPLSKPSLEIYYSALAHLSTEEFTGAATRIVRERRFTSLPTPADFLEGTQERTEDRAMLAAEEVLRMMRGAGGDADVQFSDPAVMAAVQMAGGWPFLCDYVNSFDLDKLGIWKREFAGLYRAGYARKDKAPRVLLGRHSQANIAAGYLDAETGVLTNGSGRVLKVMPWGKALPAGEAPRLVSEGEGEPTEGVGVEQFEEVVR